MKYVLRFGVGVALALSLVGAVRAQEEDDYDTTPSQPVERTWLSAVQGRPTSMSIVTTGVDPRAEVVWPRSDKGPWRFLVHCDEVTMEQPDVTGEQRGFRRVTNAVLLVETRPEWHEDAECTYSLTIEQMALDEVRGDLAGLLALPTTDALKPVPRRDGSPMYTRTLPTVIGTKGEFVVRKDGWLSKLRFKMGEGGEMDAAIGVGTVARFLTNACLPMPTMAIGQGSAWTFISEEALDGVPFDLTRRVEVQPRAEGQDGWTFSQSFTGTVEKPSRSPIMFEALTGDALTFGSALTGSGVSTWGGECPVPVSATLEWTEDCTGTFAAAAEGDTPAKEVSGISAARRTDEMHFVAESPKLFLDADAVEEEVTTPEATPDTAPDAAKAEGAAEAVAFDPQAEFATLPMDLDKAGEYLEKVLKEARSSTPKNEAGKEPKRSWLWKPGATAQQRVEVTVHSVARETDVVGTKGSEETTDATATLLLALSDTKDEDGFLKGTIKIEGLTYTLRTVDAAGEVKEEGITDEERDELMKRTIPLTVGDTGRAWASRTSMDVLNATLVGKAFIIVDALCDAAVERPMSDMDIGAGAAESLGDMASGTGTARSRVTFDQSGAEGPLHLKDVDLWFMKDHLKFKMWGEPTEATHSERVALTVRHNVDGDGLVMSNQMVMGELERLRATYVKDENELEGERVIGKQVEVRTVEEGEGSDAG